MRWRERARARNTVARHVGLKIVGPCAFRSVVEGCNAS